MKSNPKKFMKSMIIGNIFIDCYATNAVASAPYTIKGGEKALKVSPINSNTP